MKDAAEGVKAINQSRREPSIAAIWKLSGLTFKETASKVIFFGMIVSVLVISSISFIDGVKWVNRSFPGFLVNGRLIVGVIGQYHWPGKQAGLRFPDKVIAANGRDLSSVGDLADVMKRTPVGEPVTWTIQRGGKVFEVSIPAVRFTWIDLLVCFGLEFLNGFIYLIIAIVVFILKPNTKVSWAFFIAAFLLGTSWILGFDAESHLNFIRLYLVIITFIPAAGVHLSLVFPEERKLVERYPYVTLIPYVVSTVITLASEATYPGPVFPYVAQAIHTYTLLAAAALIFSTLLAYFKSPSHLARQRAKVVLFGTALAFPIPAFGILWGFLGRTIGGVSIQNNFFAIPLLVFPASIALAIAKHNLFDVDVYIKRAVGYVIMTAVVGFGYFSIQTVTTKFIFKPLFGEYADEVFPIAFALLVVFGFDPINRRIQSAVERIFFRAKLDYKETVRSVSSALASLLNLDQILARVVDTLRKEMFVDAVGLFVLEPQKAACRNYFDSDDLTASGNGRHEVAVQPDDPLLALLSRGKKLVTKYDIAEDPRYTAEKDSCGESFTRVAGSLAVPLIYQGEVTGVLTLGHKKSGHFFTREDIDLLDTLADGAAVAIENARLAEQMKKEETVRTNLSRYLSPQIVDQIVKNDVQVNLGGDKKVVTVLFSDIRNFTGITETQPPDKLVRLLNEYFTEMAGIIFANQGSLDKYIGDAIIAVFGSLINLDNPARHAVQAAIEMMKRLPHLNERWKAEYGFEMQIGIGLNTGEVFLGNIGSPERMEFTVIGDTVNVASRFSGLAKPGQILITRETLNCLDSAREHRELPPTEVKGKTGKLEVFEMLGA